MGLGESMIAGQVLIEIGVFARRHDLGIPAGTDGTVRLLKGLVRIPDVAFFGWDKLPGASCRPSRSRTSHPTWPSKFSARRTRPRRWNASCANISSLASASSG